MGSEPALGSQMPTEEDRLGGGAEGEVSHNLCPEMEGGISTLWDFRSVPRKPLWPRVPSAPVGSASVSPAAVPIACVGGHAWGPRASLL